MPTLVSTEAMYSPLLIEKCFRSLPLKRRILAHFFERYRLSQKEYEDWFLRLLALKSK